MSQVTWKDLAKTIIDKTKVSEEIDEKVLDHNQDPSAHKQEGEALDTHRTLATIDHPAKFKSTVEEVDDDITTAEWVDLVMTEISITVDNPCWLHLVGTIDLYNSLANNGVYAMIHCTDYPAGAVSAMVDTPIIKAGDDPVSAIDHWGPTFFSRGLFHCTKPGTYKFKWQWKVISAGHAYCDTLSLISFVLGGDAV